MYRERKRLKRRSGMMSVQSVLFGILLSTIIAGVGLSALSKQGKKSNVRAVSSDISVISTAVTDSFEDLGVPVFASDQIGAFKDYLTQLENGYVGVKFDLDTVEATTNGFKVDTTDPKDSFGGTYHFRFVTAEDTLHSVMICSWGPNGVSDEAGYATKNYGDDIVAVANVRE